MSNLQKRIREIYEHAQADSNREFNYSTNVFGGDLNRSKLQDRIENFIKNVLDTFTKQNLDPLTNIDVYLKTFSNGLVINDTDSSSHLLYLSNGNVNDDKSVLFILFYLRIINCYCILPHMSMS